MKVRVKRRKYVSVNTKHVYVRGYQGVTSVLFWCVVLVRERKQSDSENREHDSIEHLKVRDNIVKAA